MYQIESQVSVTGGAVRVGVNCIKKKQIENGSSIGLRVNLGNALTSNQDMTKLILNFEYMTLLFLLQGSYSIQDKRQKFCLHKTIL